MKTTPTPRHPLARTLLAALLLACVPAAVRAQVVTPQPAPTIITSVPYTITSAGYYQLGADLGVSTTSGAIITINASNVTLDFGGHYIVGPNDASSQLVGVQISEQGNVNIKNGTIAFCYRGINFEGNNSANSIEINEAVSNMLVSRCFFEAIRLQACSGSTIRDCRVTLTSGTGNIFAVYSSSGTGGNQILNTSVSGTSTTGTGTAYGIYANSSGCQVTTCTVDSVTTASGGSAYGIYLPAFALGNTVSNCQTGIFGATKYANNLTANCTTAFSGGTAVGFNN